MPELVREPVPLRRPVHRHLVAHPLQQRHHPVPGLIGAAVQQHVEQGEFQLAHGLHAALEVLRRQHPVEQVIGQRLAGFHVPAHRLHPPALPAEVLHELAGQLHCIPLHAVDAGHGQGAHLGQHLVQAVAHLVEEREHFIVAERGRLAVHALAEVAHQVHHRRLFAGGQLAAVAAVVHPRPAALARPRVRVQVELADQAPRRIPERIEAHVPVPHRRVVLLHGNTVQVVDQAEQPLQHVRLGEVLLHLQRRVAVARLAQLFAGPGQVPGLQRVQPQLVAGEGFQFGAVALRVWPGLGCQLAQEAEHFVRRLGHLGGQRNFGIAVEAEQPGEFRAQGEDAFDVAGVVQLLRPGFRGPHAVGAVEGLAQAAVVGPGLHGQVAGHVQGQLPALAAVFLGGCAAAGKHVGGQAGQFVFVFHVEGEGVGGVEEVLGEFGGEGGQFLLDFGEAGALVVLKFGAAEAEVAQGVFDGLAAGLVIGLEFRRLGEGAVLGVERLVLAEGAEEPGDLGEGGVVGLADLGGVHHRLQVGDLAPGAAEFFGGVLEGGDEGVPGDGGDVPGLFDCGFGFFQQGVDRGGDVGGGDLVEAGEVGEVEQGVGHVEVFGLDSLEGWGRWGWSPRVVSGEGTSRRLTDTVCLGLVAESVTS